MRCKEEVPFETQAIEGDELHKKIAGVIEEKILRSELLPGSRLPAERDLATLFEVSRVTVRDAVYMLEQRGLVQRRQGSGTFVRDTTHTVISESIQRYLQLKNYSHLKAIEVRELIEPEIAARVALHATAEELEAIGRLVDEIEQGFEANNVSGNLAADTGFHEALARACGNELLAAIALGLYMLMKTWLAEQRNDPRKEAVYQHRKIFKALLAHEPERARQAALEHLALAREGQREDGGKVN